MKKACILSFYRALMKRRLQDLFARFISRLEGGEMYSKTLREIYKQYHGMDVGLYSYGCFFNHNIRPGVTIGRYCSISRDVSIMDANHPIHHKSTHPFFYEPSCHYVDQSYVQSIPTVIENDVWIGMRSIIIPSVQKIGNGAIIAAGAVVTKDVPGYAIVAGNPAKIIRYRFSRQVIEKLEEEQWWQHDIDELKPEIQTFTHFHELVSSSFAQ